MNVLLFATNPYDEGGGWSDLLGVYDSSTRARDEFAASDFEYAQLIIDNELRAEYVHGKWETSCTNCGHSSPHKDGTCGEYGPPVTYAADSTFGLLTPCPCSDYKPAPLPWEVPAQ